MISLSFYKFPLYSLIAILSFQLAGARAPEFKRRSDDHDDHTFDSQPQNPNPDPNQYGTKREMIGTFSVYPEIYDLFCDNSAQPNPVACFDLNTISDELRNSKGVDGYFSGDKKHLVISIGFSSDSALWETPKYNIELKSHPFTRPNWEPIPCLEMHFKPKPGTQGTEGPGYMYCRGFPNLSLPI